MAFTTPCRIATNYQKSLRITIDENLVFCNVKSTYRVNKTADTSLRLSRLKFEIHPELKYVISSHKIVSKMRVSIASNVMNSPKT